MEYKRSPGSPLLYERYKSGCAWSLIGFCDFSQGHPNKKLISQRGLNSHVADDRRIKNRIDLLSNSDENCQCSENGVNKTLSEDSSTADVTRTSEEGMASEQQTKKKITTSGVNHVQSDSQPVGHRAKNHRRKASKAFLMHGCKDISTVVHTQPSYENSGSTSKRFNSAALNETSCNRVHPKNGRDCSCRSVSCQKNDQLSEINLQVQMNEAAEAFINQKFVNRKYHGRDQASHQSKHFLDALEILNSNKELFIKLLQDPNSLLVKHIQDLRDSQAKEQETRSLSETTLSETCRTSVRGCGDAAYTQKSSDRYPSKGIVDPQLSKTIVGLKSGPTCMQNSAGELRDCSSQHSLYSMRNKAQDAKPAYFSFEHMKRKLRHAIGLSRKEKSLSSTVKLHKSSRDTQGFGDGGRGNDLKILERSSPCIYSDIGRMEKSSLDVKRREEVGKVKGFESGTRQEVALNSGSGHDNSKLSIVRHLQQRESNIYINPTKHLSHMLRNGNEVFLRKQFPKTLGRIISVPEYDFLSAPSPQRHQEHGFSSGQMRFSPYSNFQMVNEKRQRFQKEKNSYLGPDRQTVEAPSSANNKILKQRLQTFDTKPNISENHFSDIKMHESVSSRNHTLSLTGSVGIVEMCNAISMGDFSSPRVPLEPNDQRHIGTNKCTAIAKGFEENQYLKCLEVDSSAENFTPLSPKIVYSSSLLSVKSLEDSNDMRDKTEHPSPVSVLEQFAEDITSPPSTTSQPAELAVEPKQINYEEPFSTTFTISSVDLKINSSNARDEDNCMSKYIRAVLQASGINLDELLMKCHSSGQLLDSCLFDKMKVLPTQFQGDNKLLFDYTNEVLGEVYESNFGCSPWLSFAKQKIQPVQAGTSMVSEVMKCVDWHLLSQESSLALDQLMQKDLAKSITWMDIRIDIQEIVNEMVERLLEELALETAIDLNS